MQQPELGKKITALRKDKNLTQEELASLSKVSGRTIQRIENGEVVPRPYSLRNIFSALGHDPKESTKKGHSNPGWGVGVLAAGMALVLFSFWKITAGSVADPAVIKIQSTADTPPEMFYSLPVNGTSDFSFREIIVFDSTGLATIELHLDEISMIQLITMGKVGTFIIAEPGQHYSVILDDDPESNTVTIEGYGSDALTAFNTLNHFPVVQITARPYRDMGLDSVKTALRDSLNNDLEPFRNMLGTGDISNDFYEMVKLDRESMYANALGDVAYLRYLDHWRNKNGKYSVSVKDFWQEAFLNGPPVDETLLKSKWAGSYIENYLKFIRYNDPDFDSATVMNTFMDGHRITWFLDQSEKYLDPEVNEFFTASYLYSQAFQQHFEKELIGLHDEFITTYPESNYLPFLKPVIDPVVQFHNEKEWTLETEYKNLTSLATEVNSLTELVGQFKGKNLFIDVWATWCGPCKEAFAKNEALYKLLKEKGIEPLYLSIDQESQDQRWRELSRFYQLQGHHIRANQKLHKNLFKEYSESGRGIEIPWYMLVNEQGEIVVRHASGPSELSELEDEINQYLPSR